MSERRPPPPRSSYGTRAPLGWRRFNGGRGIFHRNGVRLGHRADVGTPGRMWLIAALFGLFVLTSVVALLVLKALKNNPQGLLARTRLEWQKDRLLLDDLLARSGGEANRSS